MNYSWECNGDEELSFYRDEERDPFGLSDDFSDAPGEDPLDAILGEREFEYRFLFSDDSEEDPAEEDPLYSILTEPDHSYRPPFSVGDRGLLYGDDPFADADGYAFEDHSREFDSSDYDDL